jgi:hypothetical protein
MGANHTRPSTVNDTQSRTIWFGQFVAVVGRTREMFREDVADVGDGFDDGPL